MLSLENIKVIEDEVIRAGISYSHLPVDLVDHICCDVEDEMSHGEPFERAFGKVKEKIGIEGLKNIEVQTILFINQNYIIMKKALNVLSVFAVSFIVLSGLMKILHLPGANIILLASIMALVLGFVPLLFLTRNKEDKERKQVWVNIAGYLSSTFFLLSFLWTIMHWPGRNFFILVSWVLILCFFLPVYLITALKAETVEKRLTHIGVILLITLLLVFEIVISLNRQRSSYYQYDEVSINTAELGNYLESRNENIYSYFLTDSLRPDTEIQKLMVLAGESKKLRDALDALGKEIDEMNDFDRIRYKDNIPADLDKQADRIQDLANRYRDMLLQEFAPGPELSGLISRTFETSRAEDDMPVYELYFRKSVVVVRNNMFKLRNDVLFIENAVLNSILDDAKAG